MGPCTLNWKVFPSPPISTAVQCTCCVLCAQVQTHTAHSAEGFQMCVPTEHCSQKESDLDVQNFPQKQEALLWVGQRLWRHLNPL
jgi:hypothetical protein